MEYRVPNNPVHRIQLGKYILPQPSADGYILSYGKKPAPEQPMGDTLEPQPTKRVMRVSGTHITEQVFRAAAELQTTELKLEKGPYADRNGSVAELIREIRSLVSASQDPTSHETIIECIMDVLRPYADAQAENMFPRFYQSEIYNFFLNERALVPDALTSAGAILTQNERLVNDSVTGAYMITLTHMMEPFMLATAVLRRFNIPAYPALAVVHGQQGEIHSPLIALVDATDEETPLHTFALVRAHPPAGSVILLGDTAMEAVTYAILAEARVNRLTREISNQADNPNAVYAPEVFRDAIQRISDALFESYKRWPENTFVAMAFRFIFTEVSDTLTVIPLLKQGFNPDGPVPKEVLDAIAPLADSKANELSESVRRMMGNKLRAAGLIPPENARPPADSPPQA